MSLTVLCFLGIVARLLALLPVTQAQSTTATCSPEFNWMNNSHNQSTCLVAAYAQGACNGGQFTVAALPPDHHYTGPLADQVNSCQCSTVVYSLVSACAVCQNRTIEAWSAWDLNCTSTFVSQFPEQIPAGTSIPAWAYLDVTTGDTFDVNAALADLSAPESSGSAKPTASTTSTVGSTTSGPSITLTTPTPGESDTSPTGASKKSSNAGAIAGGVVGGLVGFGLIIGVLVFFFIRRPRNRIAPSAAYGVGYIEGAHSDAPLNTPPPMSQHSYTNQSPRLYDPSDPSTYPQSPPTPTVQTTNAAPHPYAHMHQPNPGLYSGVPEL